MKTMKIVTLEIKKDWTRYITFRTLDGIKDQGKSN